MPERRLSFLLVSTLLTIMLGGWVLTSALSSTIGRADQTKALLNKSGLYQALIPSQVADAQKANPSLASLPLDNPEIQKVLASSLGTGQLQAEGNKAVDGIYGWLEGKSSQPKINIAVKADQQALATAAGDYAAKYAATLPTCAPGEGNYADFANDPLSATCLPRGIDAAMTRSAVMTAVLSNPALGSTTEITQDDVKLPGNKTIMSAFGSAPKWYHWGRLLPLLTAAGAVLFALLLLLILRPAAGIKSVGKHMLSVSITLGICAILLAWGLGKGLDSILPKSSNPNVSDALMKLTNLFDDAYRDNIVHLSASLAIGGLVLVVLAFILRHLHHRSAAVSRKPDEPHIPEPVSLTAAPTVAKFTPSGPPALPKAKSAKPAHKKATPKKKPAAKKPATRRHKKS